MTGVVWPWAILLSGVRARLYVPTGASHTSGKAKKPRGFTPEHFRFCFFGIRNTCFNKVFVVLTRPLKKKKTPLLYYCINLYRNTQERLPYLLETRRLKRKLTLDVTISSTNYLYFFFLNHKSGDFDLDWCVATPAWGAFGTGGVM